MGGCLRWAGPCDAAISEAWSRNKHLATLYFIYTFSNFNIINVSSLKSGFLTCPVLGGEQDVCVGNYILFIAGNKKNIM